MLVRAHASDRGLELFEVTREAISDWYKEKTTWERSVMLKQARRARIFTIFGYSMILSCLINFSIAPYFGITSRILNNITDPEMEDGHFLPLQMYFPFEALRSPTFELLYILVTIAMLFNAIAFTVPDNLFGALIFHLSAQVEILGDKMQHVFDGLQKFGAKDKNTFESRIKHIVDEQSRLRRLSRTIEKSFELIILTQVIGLSIAVISFGVGTLDALSNEGGLSAIRLLIAAGALSSLLFQIFIYCIASEVYTHHVSDTRGILQLNFSRFDVYECTRVRGNSFAWMEVCGQSNISFT
ncbi:hypothetical protein QAD02_000945 [Eretmocerus hayati]|uniref:Uncharacterized protein n=1 Tax=Eretmocerus hayati TaxID=131215 RepID=A0ACC2NGA2_9HYME|nr:hypothetical protein QAD02_000945 [Eretmocerus hayati]